MVLLGLLIPLGVGVLAAMELKTPARTTAVAVPPVAEIEGGIFEPRGVLAKADQPEKTNQLEKADRLEIAAASSETPARPALVDERNSPPAGTSVGSSEPRRLINRHRHEPKKVTTAAPKSKPKKADVKQTAISEGRKAGNTGPCRLSAFGGLLKALGSTGCEI
jgi:hypothetical protein